MDNWKRDSIGEFEDENHDLKFDKPYLLAMASGSKDSNTSQFFINLARTYHYDGYFVVFGQVLEGHNVIKKLESLGQPSGKPKMKVKIMDSGEIDIGNSTWAPNLVNEVEIQT